MKKILVFLLITFVYNAIYAQTETKQQLKNWEFYRSDVGGLYEVWRDKQLSVIPEWQRVELPHCYNASDAVSTESAMYQGPAWYRTYIDAKNPYNNGRTILHFEGAGQKAKVFVFNTLIGEHVGGYDEFDMDITDAVNAYNKNNNNKFNGKIPIAVRVDNSRDVEMLPSDLSDFNLYGGLYRSVNLVYVPQISIQKAFINPVVADDFKSAKVAVKLRLYNPQNKSGEASLAIELTSPQGDKVYSSSQKITITKGDKQIENFEVKNPILWNPENPELYKLTIKLKTNSDEQTVTENIGFRSFEFTEKGPFKLNGERLLLRGTHRHEDHAGLGAAMTNELTRREMTMMREMGVNFIRLGHYQQSKLVLDLCDELGIMVWEEIPWCRGGLGGNLYKDQARRMLTNLIEQHYNHPSVIIWGLGNENDWEGDFAEFDKDKIRAFMTELNNLAHKLNPERKTAIRRCDFCKDIVDVYSPSIWAGWYRGRYSDYNRVSYNEMQKVNHFLHVEWGADNHAGRFSLHPEKDLTIASSTENADERAGDFLMSGGDIRASKDGDWSETYAVNLIDWHLKEQETMDWLTGTAYWPFKDFSTPLRPENPIPYVNQKGVVQRDLTPKEGYYVFQSYWTDKPMVHIFGHQWTTRWTENNEPSEIKVFSNCPNVELFVNGVSKGQKKRDSKDFPAAGLRWTVKLAEGENHIKAIGSKDGETIIDELTVNFQTLEWGKPSQLIFEEIENHNDTSTIRVLALDEKGVLCLDARNYAEFGVSGAGHLIDNMGTTLGSRKIQMQNGRALIKVKLNNNQSVASVAVDGVGTAFVKLNCPQSANTEKL